MRDMRMVWAILLLVVITVVVGVICYLNAAEGVETVTGKTLI